MDLRTGTENYANMSIEEVRQRRLAYFEAAKSSPQQSDGGRGGPREQELRKEQATDVKSVEAEKVERRQPQLEYGSQAGISVGKDWNVGAWPAKEASLGAEARGAGNLTSVGPTTSLDVTGKLSSTPLLRNGLEELGPASISPQREKQLLSPQTPVSVSLLQNNSYFDKPGRQEVSDGHSLHQNSVSGENRSGSFSSAKPARQSLGSPKHCSHGSPFVGQAKGLPVTTDPNRILKDLGYNFQISGGSQEAQERPEVPRLSLKDSQDLDAMTVFRSEADFTDLGLSTHRPEEGSTIGDQAAWDSQHSRGTEDKFVDPAISQELRSLLGERKYQEFVQKSIQDINKLYKHKTTETSPHLLQGVVPTPKSPAAAGKGMMPHSNKKKGSKELDSKQQSSKVQEQPSKQQGSKTEAEQPNNLRTSAAPRPTLQRPKADPPLIQNLVTKTIQDLEVEETASQCSSRRNYDQVVVPHHVTFSAGEIYRQAFGQQTPPQRSRLNEASAHNASSPSHRPDQSPDMYQGQPHPPFIPDTSKPPPGYPFMQQMPQPPPYFAGPSGMNQMPGTPPSHNQNYFSPYNQYGPQDFGYSGNAAHFSQSPHFQQQVFGPQPPSFPPWVQHQYPPQSPSTPPGFMHGRGPAGHNQGEGFGPMQRQNSYGYMQDENGQGYVQGRNSQGYMLRENGWDFMPGGQAHGHMPIMNGPGSMHRERMPGYPQGESNQAFMPRGGNASYANGGFVNQGFAPGTSPMHPPHWAGMHQGGGPDEFYGPPVPHPPPGPPHRTGSESPGGQSSARRHVEEIRLHHEQRRQKNEEEAVTAEMAAATDAVKEEAPSTHKKKTFAKDSLTRYFTSIETVYPLQGDGPSSAREKKGKKGPSASKTSQPPASPPAEEAEPDLEETMVDSMAPSAVSGVSTRAGGITERLEHLGIDPTLVKKPAETRSRGSSSESSHKGSRKVKRCPNCSAKNKEYVSWCLDCGEVLIGVEPEGSGKKGKGKAVEKQASVQKANVQTAARDPLQAQVRTDSREGYSFDMNGNNSAEIMDWKKDLTKNGLEYENTNNNNHNDYTMEEAVEVDVPKKDFLGSKSDKVDDLFDEDNHPRHKSKEEAELAEILSVENFLKDLEIDVMVDDDGISTIRCTDRSEIHQQPDGEADSAAKSQVVYQGAAPRTPHDVNEICENIADPILRGYIRSYFSKKASGDNPTPYVSGKDGSGPSSAKAGKVKLQAWGDPKDFKARVMKKAASRQEAGGSGRGRRKDKPLRTDSRGGLESPKKGKSPRVKSKQSASAEELEDEPSSRENKMDGPSRAPKSPAATESPGKSPTPRSRKKKPNGAIDIEVFGIEENKQIKSARQEAPKVPFLNLRGSSDDEDEYSAVNMPPEFAPLGETIYTEDSSSSIVTTSVEIPNPQAHNPVVATVNEAVNEMFASPPYRGLELSANASASGGEALGNPDLEGEGKGEASARDATEAADDAGDGASHEPFLAHLLTRDEDWKKTRPRKPKGQTGNNARNSKAPNGNSSKMQNQASQPRSWSAGKTSTSSVDNSSSAPPRPSSSGEVERKPLAAPGYARHWNRSSIAWSSYNPRELNTQSSVQAPQQAAESSVQPSTSTASNRASKPPPPRNEGMISSEGPQVPHPPAESRPQGGRGGRPQPRPVSADMTKRRMPASSGRPASAHFSQRGRTSSDSVAEGEASGEGVASLPAAPAGDRPSGPDPRGQVRDDLAVPPVVDHRLSAAEAHIHPHSVNQITDHTSAVEAYSKYLQMSPRLRETELSPWLFLPEEIWLHIMSYVAHADLARCAIVCKTFYRIAMDETLWKYITVRKNNQLTDEHLVFVGKLHPVSLALIQCHGDNITGPGLRDLFRECADTLRELNFSRCSRGGLTGDSILLHASARCRSLTHVDASWCHLSDNGLSAVSECAHRLQSVCINGCQFITNDGLECLLKKHGTSLKTLEMFGCFNISPGGLRMIGMHCSNLQTLNLGQCHKLTDTCIIQITANLGTLLTLDLRGCKQIKDHCIFKVVQHCPRLQKLALANCPLISDRAIKDVATYCKDIRVLDVCGCRNVTDIGTLTLASNSARLAQLDLSSTGCTHNSVNILATSDVKWTLEVLKLNFLADVTEHGLTKLVKSCRRLKILHLYGCTSVRDLSRLRSANRFLDVEMS